MRIAVLTSGGDAPGMNATIRAVVRTVDGAGGEAVGVRHGFAGLLAADWLPLGARDVGGIVDRGGTMLGSARCPEFRTADAQERAAANLRAAEIDGVVVIGGNGTQTGANALARLGLAVNGVASTIDNDLEGTDITLGVDTALNVALESVDRLRTTAASHDRAFLVEVMGRDCGYLAVAAAITGGAEAVVTPELPTTPDELAATLAASRARGKRHAIVVVAEGVPGGAMGFARAFAARPDLGLDLRVTILGHVQRGARPSAFDRLLGTRLGHAAATALLEGRHGFLFGLSEAAVRAVPLADVAGRTRPLDPMLLKLAATMAR
ncbi:MAG: ATP-dependent 6-phosphofructokinase [Pseudomonadota bacterium]|nr:ATP-dependent 6-phosphofructokinase [Pseudomonadota bacterium]